MFPEWTCPEACNLEVTDTVSVANVEEMDTFANIHCGLIVEQLAWVPLPSSVNEQVLVLLCKPKDLPYMKMSHREPKETIIQLWEIEKGNKFRASHLYSIIRPDGPICAIKFCPSGGYSKDRLGLLAVSSVNGDVNILALPHPQKGFKGKEVKLPPSCVLKGNVDSVGTTIDWDRRLGHSYVMAGFLNGAVAVWKIPGDDLQFLRDDDGGVLPFKLMQPFSVPVSKVEMNHDHFLATGGPTLKIFNMDRFTEVANMTYTVLDISCSQWIPNTPYVVIGISKSATSIGLYLHQVFSLKMDSFRLISLEKGVISAVAFSNSLGKLVTGTEDGEVWFRGMSESRMWNQGISFRKRLSVISNGHVYAAGRAPKGKNLSTESVKCIDFNQGEACKRWYAVGYEKGLVRVNKLSMED